MNFWNIFIDWIVYKKIQYNYPSCGELCTLDNPPLKCIVLSNIYGNRAVLLQVIDDNRIIILSYCWQPWKPWITYLVQLSPKYIATSIF
jgi:hypothetical protein